MKRMLFALAAIAALSAAFVPVGRAEERDGEKIKGVEGIEWMTDLAAANAKAAETGRPLLVVFR